MSASLSDWGNSGNNASIAFSAVPTDAYSPDVAPDINFQTQAFPQGILDDPSASAVTTTANPSLIASPSTLSSTGGAALNTVAANPTVYSTGSGGVVADLSSVGSVIGQWGFSIASLAGIGSPSSGATAAHGVSVGRASTSPAMSNSTKYILFGVALLVVILVVMDAE